MSVFYDEASLVLVPSGYKAEKVYAQKPLTTDGQLTFSRASTATRVNASGLVETVASNVPRLDYLGSTCPKLLLEPQRTNLALYSEQFDNAAWVRDQITFTANTAISPDGYQNADTLTINTSGSNLITQVVTVAASTAYTFSFYVKRGTATDLKYSIFDVTNTANIVAPTSYYSQTSSSQWTRVSVAFTTPVGCTSIACYPIRDAASTGTVILWGAQLEAGAYATSYIPTLGASVTRVADAASKTGISSLIGQTEGTIFWEGKVGFNNLEVYVFLQNTLGNSIVDSIFIQRASGVGVVFNIYDSSTQVVNISGGTYTIGQTLKIAAAYKLNDVVLYVNGVQIGTDTSATIPATTSMQLGVYPGLPTTELYMADNVKQALLFKTRLTNAELAEITQL